MEGEQREKRSLSNRKIRRNESLPKRKKYEKMAQSSNSIVAQQQMNNVGSENIGQSKSVKAVQGAPSATEPTPSINLDIQRISRHFPTFSYPLGTAPVAMVSGLSTVISNASDAVKQTSNKVSRISLGTTQGVSSNQEHTRFIRDISGDKVAVGELHGRISVALPECREKSSGNQERLNGLQTPLQSPRLHVKYCNDLLMAPKKRRCTRSYRMTKTPG
ncbi:hypothetical protein LOAG_13200 [Loa loa]|uniref:Uncharacterized protein n=1 Tax=Loa loa TaxID=7209 RepID=A0A1I7W0B4_LOALO|nr:hypothetical protein LOAG_13200 [Loa loa]EFO15313.1 hypothetical protein LOAG_13200 [Loa loa]